SLRGDPGSVLQSGIEVKTPEKRPVYAHATCDQPWVDVSKVALNGRIANITVQIPRVPDCPGETLQANIRVSANGNQRFVVPLTLTITGTPRIGAYGLAPEPIPVQAIPVQAIPVQAIPVQPVYAQAVLAQPVMAVAVPAGPANVPFVMAE